MQERVGKNIRIIAFLALETKSEDGEIIMGLSFYLAFTNDISFEDLYSRFGDWVTSKTGVRSPIKFLNWYDDDNVHLRIEGNDKAEWDLEAYQHETWSHAPMFSEELLFNALDVASKKLNATPKSFLEVVFSVYNQDGLLCIIDLARFYYESFPCVIINDFGEVYTFEEALSKFKNNEPFLWPND